MSFGASADEALTALKKLRSRCEVGISYRDYSGAIADANYEVKEYLGSSQAKQYPEVAKYINGALLDYVYAVALWHSKFATRWGEFVDPDDYRWKSFIEMYPDAGYLMKTEYSDVLKENITNVYLPVMLSYIWEQAGNKIDKACDLKVSIPPRESKKKINQ